MNENDAKTKHIRGFWDHRSTDQHHSGTKDFIAKELEVENILKLISQEDRNIIEYGCGAGQLSIMIAEQYADSCVTGVDYSTRMIEAAKCAAENLTCSGRIDFQEGDVLSLEKLNGVYDLAITERCLINLRTLDEQRLALENISRHLRVGGRFVMCENSIDGLNAINLMRNMLDLETITPPWHNLYFDESEIVCIAPKSLRLDGQINYSSTYYFLSRVINAALAKYDGRTVDYGDQINRLALNLPPITDCAQGKIWLWEKIA